MSNILRVDDPSAHSVNQAIHTLHASAAYSVDRTALVSVPLHESRYTLPEQQALHSEAPGRLAHFPIPDYHPGPSPQPAIYTPTPPADPTQHHWDPIDQPPGYNDNWTCGLEGCNVRLDDLTVGGQRRHLRSFHGAQLGGSRVRCTWVHEGGITCGKRMDSASWGKHLASVHWGSTKEKCPHCPKYICRRDALKRHIANHHRDQERI